MYIKIVFSESPLHFLLSAHPNTFTTMKFGLVALVVLALLACLTSYASAADNNLVDPTTE